MRPTYRPALVCAGQAIMQGKLVCSQSASTFLFLNRFSIPALVSLNSAERQPSSWDCERRLAKNAGSGGRNPSPHWSLLRQGEIRFTPARHCDGLRLVLRALVPSRDRIAAVGNVFDL